MELRHEDFFAFITEREAIRQRREANEPFLKGPYPWTRDPILGEWKFTNVKREHDATSRALIQEFYTPNADRSRQEILFNCAVARYFGTVEFMRAVGWQNLDVIKHDPKAGLDNIASIARSRLTAKQRVFTGAYIITNNGIAGNKEDVVCHTFLADLLPQLDDVCDAAQKRWHWQDMIERLQKVRGFGGTGFMAKETVLDTRYTNFWPENMPADTNIWTPVGPGSMRGAARIAGHNDQRSFNVEATLSVCKTLYKMVDYYWPEAYPELELHDIQFQNCEFDKRERVRLGQGTPRSRFRATR